MKQFVFSLLFLCGYTGYAQNMQYYQWHAVTPSIKCSDSTIVTDSCVVAHFVVDTQRNTLWVIGGFNGGGNIISPSIIGYNGHQYIDASKDKSSIKYTPDNTPYACIMYKGKIAIAFRNSIVLYDPDSMKGGFKGTYIGVISSAAPNSIECLGLYHGDLIAAGTFYSIKKPGGNGVGVSCVARWDGSNWHSLGQSIGGNCYSVRSVKEYHNKLYVSGCFTKVGSIDAWNIASWDGTNWECLCAGTGRYGTGNELPGYDWSGDIFDMDIINDKLYVVGRYDSVCNIKTHLGYWDGSQWTGTNYPYEESHIIKSYKNIPIIQSWDGNPFHLFYWNNGQAATVDSLIAVVLF